MSGPYQHGSSGFQEPSSPPTPSARTTGRYPSPYSSVASAGAAANFYSHPSRTSVLNSAGDLTLGGSTGLGGLGLINNVNMEGAELGAEARAWRGGLPSFSRAFNMLMAAEAADGSAQNDEEIFFIPSYLAGSTYVQKLEEAYRSKLQARESTRTSASGLSPNLTTFNPNQHPLPPGSHRGMSHTVIERPPVFEEDESLAPLPSKWNKDDQWGGIEIQPDGMSIKYVGPKNQHDRDHEACAVRADHYMPAQCGVYYYEVQILSAKRDEYVESGDVIAEHPWHDEDFDADERTVRL